MFFKLKIWQSVLKNGNTESTRVSHSRSQGLYYNAQEGVEPPSQLIVSICVNANAQIKGIFWQRKMTRPWLQALLVELRDHYCYSATSTYLLQRKRYFDRFTFSLRVEPGEWSMTKNYQQRPTFCNILNSIAPFALSETDCWLVTSEFHWCICQFETVQKCVASKLCQIFGLLNLKFSKGSQQCPCKNLSAFWRVCVCVCV